jgi:hypothetical protein
MDRLDTMSGRGTRGAYRKEDRVQLPAELQKELVEKAAARYGNCQELAKHLNIPKSSVHYYRVGKLTMPVSILDEILRIAGDDGLREKVTSRGITKDRTWANEYSASVYREMCRDLLRLPTIQDLQEDDGLRRKAASIVSYVLAEGSVWLQKSIWGECAVNITFSNGEQDLYQHFRNLCLDVFRYDIGNPQLPGNGAKAIRGFIYSRFVAEWLMQNGIMPGEKSCRSLHLPRWIMESEDHATLKAALQPWCDGEGSPICSRNGRVVGYSLGQSRHTDLDFLALPKELARTADRGIGAGILGQIDAFGIPARDYVAMTSRSEILEDISALFRRLGFSPRMKLNRLHLKDNGYWSAFWLLVFYRNDALKLLDWGLVITEKKRTRMAAGR